MKDAYSFDIDSAGLDESYNKHDRAYRAIFTRCGLEFVAVEADSGAMGGSQSQEFMVYTEAGEDLIASSPPATPPISKKPLANFLQCRISKRLQTQAGARAHSRPAHHRRRLRLPQDSASQDIKCVAFMGTLHRRPSCR
jgi:hypothetical protein